MLVLHDIIHTSSQKANNSLCTRLQPYSYNNDLSLGISHYSLPFDYYMESILFVIHRCSDETDMSYLSKWLLINPVLTP